MEINAFSFDNTNTKKSNLHVLELRVTNSYHDNQVTPCSQFREDIVPRGPKIYS